MTASSQDRSGFAKKLFNCWHPVAYGREVSTEKPYGTKLLDEHLVIWRTADGTPQAMRQDQRIVESQRPEQVPFDLADELHLNFDAVAIYYRRAMQRQGLHYYHYLDVIE